MEENNFQITSSFIVFKRVWFCDQHMRVNNSLMNLHYSLHRNKYHRLIPVTQEYANNAGIVQK
jgi:hypothetical protein